MTRAEPKISDIVVEIVTFFLVQPHKRRCPKQCCNGLVAQKKYKKSRKKVQILPQKSTPSVFDSIVISYLKVIE